MRGTNEGGMRNGKREAQMRTNGKREAQMRANVETRNGKRECISGPLQLKRDGLVLGGVFCGHPHLWQTLQPIYGGAYILPENLHLLALKVLHSQFLLLRLSRRSLTEEIRRILSW